MTQDNKKKKEYIAPISLGTQDLIGIKEKAIQQALESKTEDIGIFEFVDNTWAKTLPKRLNDFANKVKMYRQGDFYLEVEASDDKLLTLLHVKKNQKLKIMDRRTCPNPRPGHHVYKYHANSGSLEHLWNIPDIQYINIVKANAVDMEFASLMKDLIDCIYKFEDGTLQRISDKENGIDTNKPKDNRVLKLNNIEIETDTRLKTREEVYGRHHE